MRKCSFCKCENIPSEAWLDRVILPNGSKSTAWICDPCADKHDLREIDRALPPVNKWQIDKNGLRLVRYMVKRAMECQREEREAASYCAEYPLGDKWATEFRRKWAKNAEKRAFITGAKTLVEYIIS